MSRSELIDAYETGRISRRTFVRGMAAIGVSTAAAVSMADRILAVGDDTYGDDDDTYGPTLPSTGIGSTSGGSWVKPMALLGAGAAIVAGGLRKLKGESVAQ